MVVGGDVWRCRNFGPCSRTNFISARSVFIECLFMKCLFYSQLPKSKSVRARQNMAVLACSFGGICFPERLAVRSKAEL